MSEFNEETDGKCLLSFNEMFEYNSWFYSVDKNSGRLTCVKVYDIDKFIEAYTEGNIGVLSGFHWFGESTPNTPGRRSIFKIEYTLKVKDSYDDDGLVDGELFSSLYEAMKYIDGSDESNIDEVTIYQIHVYRSADECLSTQSK